MDTPENKQEENDYVPVEKVSYSFLFFLVSGGLLLVTLWSFWDDEFSRRGYKMYQKIFYKAEYTQAREEWKKNNGEIEAKEKELREHLKEEEGNLESSSEYENLLAKVREAKIRLDDANIKKKFAISRLDEAYYFYKKAQHAGENFTVQKTRMDETQKEIDAFDPVVAKLQKTYDTLENQLLKFKAREIKLKKELKALTNKRDGLERTMDFYKPFPFVWKFSEIKQTVIPGARLNNFKEITYKVDRCMTCHISYDNTNYQEFNQPLKTHPNLKIYIDKHPPGRTGCTWCHKGQGPVTAPPEDAHGSHHETDQTLGLNEPILKGDFMQSQCRNCHDQVLNLKGAPVLSKAKKLFLKLGCHGCHLAEGFENQDKVGPRLLRVGSKVNPSWLFRWVKNPKAYLPKTRMPNFGFDDKDAMAVTAYLLAKSDPKYRHPETFKGGNKENGEKLFAGVGCLACHELQEKGEVFGPDLSRVASKVDPDWLVSWLSNPKEYNDQSRMPNLRLSFQEASDIAAYLLQFSKPDPIPGLEEKLKSAELIDYGKTVIRRRGCFACHDIKGMEKEGRIAPELSAFGVKQTWELEFGDSHIPHTWEAWAGTKLKNPSSYRTERVLDKMPNFNLSDDEIHSLLVLLKGFNGQHLPERFRRTLTEKEQILEAGRRLVLKFNCRGCHIIEGEGGRIRKYIKNKNLFPPPLDNTPYHVGERLKASWLFSFLKNPTPVRTWLKARMPTFFFTDKEVREITAYFEALVPKASGYEPGLNIKKHMQSIETGVKMVNYMDCGKCHDDGAKGIDFSIASERLRQDWIPNWLKNTRSLIPETRMPNHWVKEGDKYTIRSKFDLMEEVEDGNVDKQVSDIRDFIVSYNTVDFNPDLSLEDDGGDGGDEETDGEDVGDEESLDEEDELLE